MTDIEKIAEHLIEKYISGENEDEYYVGWEDGYETALDHFTGAIKSQGLVIVPREATEGMINEGLSHIHTREIYKAMIAAYEEEQ